MPDSAARLDYPATRRNAEPILAVLREVLRDGDRVLEIGSGSGQHAAHFAAHWPALRWQPSDATADTFASIAAWCDGLANVDPPRPIDAARPSGEWRLGNHVFDAVFSANVVHIAPWDVCLGLLRGAGGILKPGRPLVLYGPFQRGGHHTADSNAAFDASLRLRDPTWGVRDLDQVIAQATRNAGAQLDGHFPSQSWLRWQQLLHYRWFGGRMWDSLVVGVPR